MKTVRKALQILDTFSQDTTALGVTEIAQRLGFHKSTTHALLSTLRREGYVILDRQTRKYSLGFKPLELAGKISYHSNLRGICMPVMQELSRLTEEDVSLNIAVDGNRICIAITRGIQYVRQNIVLGMAVPLYCGAGGKCLLAFMPESRIGELLDSFTFQPFTARTITDKGKLLQELEQIRSVGFAESYEEFFTDAAALAFPLFGGNREVIASYSLHSTVSRLAAATRERFLKLGMEMACKLNELLEASGAIPEQ